MLERKNAVHKRSCAGPAQQACDVLPCRAAFGRSECAHSHAAQAVSKCLEAGIVINRTSDTTLRFLPPLIATTRDVDRLAVVLGEIGEIVEPSRRLSVFPDEPDNRIIECAVEGKAMVIVTGDKAMLDALADVIRIGAEARLSAVSWFTKPSYDTPSMPTRPLFGRTFFSSPNKYLDKVKRAIDYGAVACYIQGETADYYVKNGQPDRLAKVVELVRKNGVLVGIGAHRLETLQGCVAAGMTPDFWMKTMHHHGYWSARHPEWHDNLYCHEPAETAAWMRERREPWIAFKTMAAGAIHPKEAFRYAWENGADFVCAGMYDFQLVEDVNVALDALGSGLPARERPWMA